MIIAADSLRAVALAAYKEQQQVERERRDEEVARREQLARERFVKIFNTEPDSVDTDGKNTLVVADGIVLRYEGGFNLWGACPRCGQDCRGQTIGNPYMLGEALATGFIPNYTHNCQPAPEPEPAPMLMALLGIQNELGRIAGELESQFAKTF